MTLTAEFEYDLPEAAIAQEAIEPRDASRLLRAGDLTDHTFRELPGLLLPGDLVVVNSTRVRSARLKGHKVDSGGAVELLLLGREGSSWKALCKPARRLRAGHRVAFGHITATILSDPDEGIVELDLAAKDGAVEDAIAGSGIVPLPPYFHGRLDDEERYQTIFADRVGSAAAPTAGLHFTDRVLSDLDARGIEVVSVDLEVGLDTFRPIATETIEEHEIHTERYVIPEVTAAAIERTRRDGGRVVAIGTTATRTLETASSGSGLVNSGSGVSSLFIQPGYGFSVVDVLLTNFHAPGTSLIVLIAAILGDRWREVYATALDRGYRFLSFGDAMLLDGVRA